MQSTLNNGGPIFPRDAVGRNGDSPHPATLPELLDQLRAATDDLVEFAARASALVASVTDALALIGDEDPETAA